MPEAWRKRYCRLSVLSAARSFITATSLPVSHTVAMQPLYVHHRKCSRTGLFCIAPLVQRFFISGGARGGARTPVATPAGFAIGPSISEWGFDRTEASAQPRLARVRPGGRRRGLVSASRRRRLRERPRLRHPPQQQSLPRRRRHRLPPARKRKGCGGDFQLRCPWAGWGRWRPWCCCGRGWRSPAAPRWLSSGGALAAAPRSWRPSPIGAPRPGKATVRPSRATALPRLRLCTGQVSELSVSSCWVSFLQPTCILDQPWTIRWLQPSLSMATGVLDRL